MYNQQNKPVNQENFTKFIYIFVTILSHIFNIWHNPNDIDDQNEPSFTTILRMKCVYDDQDEGVKSRKWGNFLLLAFFPKITQY